MKKKNSLSLWKGLLFICLWALSLGVFAQNITVKGIIKDSQSEPVIGATILVKGTSKGTVTDIDGNYILSDVPSDGTLQITYVGMKTENILVNSRTTINIKLYDDSELLDEVVVVGFGTQKKINLTGAVSQVKSTDFIEERPVLSVGQSLQGVIPGLTVNRSNGEPGKGFSFNIRGQTSLNGGGPLVLVDGTEMNPDLVPPEDIESISVLKDAASASIYGSRAAFGVILIQTKSGKNDSKPVIIYSGTISSTNPTTLPDKVDPITQIKVGTLAWENAGRTPGQYWGRNSQNWIDLYEDPNWIPNSGKYIDGIYYPLGDNNMIEEMVESSLTLKHNLSLSGGSKDMRYYLNAGSMRQDGILINNKDIYSRKNVLAKMDADINNWLSAGATLSFTKGIQKMPYIPNNPSYMYDVSYLRPKFWQTGLTESGVPWGFSPAMIDLGAINTNTENITNIQLRFTVTPFKDFNINGTYSHRDVSINDSYHVNTYEMANSVDGPDVTYKYRNDPNSLRKRASFNKFDNLSITGEYSKRIASKHDFKLMVGYSQEKLHGSLFWAERQGLISDDIPSLQLATGNQSVSDQINAWSTRSVFTRLNYNYLEKYLLEAVLRYDGSSRFPKNDRFVYSPSFSAGWIVSEESFMSEMDDWLNLLKVRVSYGSQGNQAVGAYAYLPLMSTGNANWIISGEKPLYVRPGGIVSNSFTWEKVNMSNLGIDFGFLNNKLQATAEVYKRETIGMLTAAEELPAILGTSSPNENSSNLKVNGWELSINWRDNLSNDFSYRAGLILYDDKATITKYDGNPTGYLGNYFVGQVLGDIWGYETDRLFQEDDFILNNEGKRDYADGIPNQDKLFQNRVPYPGDVKYKDLNDDGVIDFGANTLEDHGDNRVIGNSRSRYQYGIKLGATFKNIELDIFMQGVGKKDLWTGGNFGFTSGVQFASIFAHTLDYWTPENTDAFYPRPDDRGYNRQTQTKYLLNAAYLRLKNVRLGYNFPKHLLGKIGVESFKLYVTGENLFMLSGLPKGLDPELGASHTYPLNKDLAFGLTLTF